MPGFIRAIVAASIFQVLAVAGLTIYMSDHDRDVARQYALLAEQNSRNYTDARILEVYSKVAEDRAADRRVFELWLNTTLDQKFLAKEQRR